MATETLSAEDKEFLAKCEEKLKDCYTEKDEEFMKVFNSGPLVPPIIDSWWVRQESGGRRNDRHYNCHHPYERHSGGGRNSNYQGRNNDDRRYRDHKRGYDYSGYDQRPRY